MPRSGAVGAADARALSIGHDARMHPLGLAREPALAAGITAGAGGLQGVPRGVASPPLDRPIRFGHPLAPRTRIQPRAVQTGMLQRQDVVTCRHARAAVADDAVGRDVAK